MPLAYAAMRWNLPKGDRKSTRLNSSHTVIYTLSLHDALPISPFRPAALATPASSRLKYGTRHAPGLCCHALESSQRRSEEHTSELQSHSDLHSFPTRRSSDLPISASRACHAGKLSPEIRNPTCPWPMLPCAGIFPK